MWLKKSLIKCNVFMLNVFMLNVFMWNEFMCSVPLCQTFYVKNYWPKINRYYYVNTFQMVHCLMVWQLLCSSFIIADMFNLDYIYLYRCSDIVKIYMYWFLSAEIVYNSPAFYYNVTILSLKQYIHLPPLIKTMFGPGRFGGVLDLFKFSQQILIGYFRLG